MLKYFQSLFTYSLKTSNLPKSSSFSWLDSPIPFQHPRLKRKNLESELFKIKHTKIDLFTDSRTRNKNPLLILHILPCFYDVPNLVIQARTLGFKSWVLQTRFKQGSLEEFDLAIDFMKEKPPIITFGNWINQIQTSQKLEFVLAVRPKFNLTEINRLIDEDNKQKNKEIEKWKASQKEERFYSEPPKVFLSPNVPELSCKKPLLLYTNSKLDQTPETLPYPTVFDKKNFFKREPFGNKELFLLKLLTSFQSQLNPK